MIRLHVPDPLSAGAEFVLGPDQSRYLTSVMRRGPGDEVLLFNGRDGEWRGRIVEAGKRGTRLAVAGLERAQQGGPDLDLVAALVKRSRLEVIVEKAAELGARRLRLAVTERTQADHANVARLRAIAVEASEQTGRMDVPEIHGPVKLERLLDDWEPGRRLLFCDEAGDARPATAALAGQPADTPWAVLIGPEGGFSPPERARLRGLDYATPATLGPRILRADTAAIAALCLWQSALGDWRD